jgi:tetratricopeptide (TPR) repeat protein
MNGATRFYQEAMSGTGEAVRRNPDDPQHLYDHAQNVFWVASINDNLGNLAAAETGMREYKRLATQMVALDPNNMKWRMENEDAEVNLGFVLYERRQFSAAVTRFTQAVGMIEALAAADPGNDQYQQNLAETLAWLADAEFGNGQIDSAINVRQRHIAVLSRLISAPNSNVRYRQRLIPAEEALGRLYLMRGQSDLGLQHLRAGVSAAERLLPIEPGNTLWLGYAMSVRFALAEALIATRQDAATDTEAACGIAQQLFTRDPRYPQWRLGMQICSTDRAKLALASGRTDEALRNAKQAVSTGSQDTTRLVDGPAIAARADLLLGDIQKSTGDSAAAAASWQSALAALPNGSSERPNELALHAAILQRLGRTAEAQPLIQRLRAMGYRAAIT